MIYISFIKMMSVQFANPLKTRGQHLTSLHDFGKLDKRVVILCLVVAKSNPLLRTYLCFFWRIPSSCERWSWHSIMLFYGTFNGIDWIQRHWTIRIKGCTCYPGHHEIWHDKFNKPKKSLVNLLSLSKWIDLGCLVKLVHFGQILKVSTSKNWIQFNNS